MKTLILLLAIPNANASVESLRVKADQLYRSKRYAEACTLYEEALKQDSNRGDLWADLGVCQKKLGKTEQAREAEFEAANRGKAADRLHAYYNLWGMGVALTPPKDEAACVNWNCNARKCTQSLAVCRYHQTCMGGTGLSSDERGLAFCPELSQAKIYQPECSANPPHSCFGVQLSGEQQGYCRPGDIGGAPCGACGCDEAPDPNVCEKTVASCREHARTQSSTNCTFVYVDAERLRVGAVCDGKAVELSPDSGL